jgi:hypothetical protein
VSQVTARAFDFLNNAVKEKVVELSVAKVLELKARARAFEQEGELSKALAVYRHLLDRLEGTPALSSELPLYVKIGDLCLKLDDPSGALDMYERAAGHYAEHGLAKSVIALCLKSERVVEGTDVYPRFARRLLEHGHDAAAVQVLAALAQRANLTGVTAVLVRLVDRADASARAMLERLLDVLEREPAAIDTVAAELVEQDAPPPVPEPAARPSAPVAYRPPRPVWPPTPVVPEPGSSAPEDAPAAASPTVEPARPETLSEASPSDESEPAAESVAAESPPVAAEFEQAPADPVESEECWTASATSVDEPVVVQLEEPGVVRLDQPPETRFEELPEEESSTFEPQVIHIEEPVESVIRLDTPVPSRWAQDAELPGGLQLPETPVAPEAFVFASPVKRPDTEALGVEPVGAPPVPPAALDRYDAEPPRRSVHDASPPPPVSAEGDEGPARPAPRLPLFGRELLDAERRRRTRSHWAWAAALVGVLGGGTALVKLGALPLGGTAAPAVELRAPAASQGAPAQNPGAATVGSERGEANSAQLALDTATVAAGSTAVDTAGVASPGLAPTVSLPVPSIATGALNVAPAPVTLEPEQEQVRVPETLTGAHLLVVVAGLPVDTVMETTWNNRAGYRVVQHLPTGQQLAITAVPIAETDAVRLNDLRMTTVPGDTSVASLRYGDYLVDARARLGADTLAGLMRRLTQARATR